MKKVIIIAAATVLTFIGSVLGVYLSMPSLSPDRVEEAQAYIDSINQALVIQDSLARLAALAPPVDSTAGPSPEEVQATLADSLQALRLQAEKLKQDRKRLQVQVDLLTRNLKRLEEQRQEAESLSGTLAKLEDRELRGILSQIDPDVLEQIYQGASSRNRVRLLQAMPSERAARFVDNLVKPGAARATLQNADAPAVTDAGAPESASK